MPKVRDYFLEAQAIHHEGATAITRSVNAPKKPYSPYVFDIQCSTLDFWKWASCVFKCASAGDHGHPEGASCVFSGETKGSCFRFDHGAAQENGFAESHALYASSVAESSLLKC